MREDNRDTSTAYRLCAYFCNVLGHYLIFSPLIALFAWIPLVGKLLSSIVAFAVFIFALIWGTALHLLVMSVAWIVYRPLYGLLLLAGVIGLVYIMSTGGKVPPETEAQLAVGRIMILIL